MTENEGIHQTETYQTIIKTAQRLFMEYGYRAVSTRQIAQICGITQPALYHHFKNKQSIYVAVIQHTLYHTETDLKTILEQTSGFAERLYEISKYMLNQYEMDMMQMFHDINHELSSTNQQLIQQWWVKGFLMPIVTLIEDGVSQNEIKKPVALDTSSTELAYFILNMIKSILQPATIAKSSESERKTKIEKSSKLILELLVNGIGL